MVIHKICNGSQLATDSLVKTNNYKNSTVNITTHVSHSNSSNGSSSKTIKSSQIGEYFLDNDENATGSILDADAIKLIVMQVI